MSAIQLDLFSWDRVKIGEGFEALSRLDFEGAIAIFEDMLLSIPEHPSATRGVELATDWERILRQFGDLKENNAIASFWDHIKRYPFGRGKGTQLFKTSLTKMLIRHINGDTSFYAPPDLCAGYLFLKTGSYKEAENALKKLINNHPFDGRLLGYLGDALWMQGRKTEARSIYTKAILISPSKVSLEDLKDIELIEFIEDEGIDMTPVYGWLKGILPLVELETEKHQEIKHSDTLKVYSLLACAENARRQGNHQKMISYRKKLKKKSPHVFNEYMEYLNGLLL